MNLYGQTQKEILEIFRRIRFPGRNATKFNGDVCCRILKHYIEREIGRAFKIVSPNAYIKGHPVEFDLLIVRSKAQPGKYTNAYEPDDVRCVIEVKSKGLVGKKQELGDQIKRIKTAFRAAQKICPKGTFVYFTFREAVPKRRGSIQYWKKTVKGLDPFRAFCMSNSRYKNPPLEGQWEAFVKHLRGCLKKSAGRR